jgi:chromosomal replication initiator protein
MATDGSASPASSALEPFKPEMGGEMNTDRRVISIPEVQTAVARVFHLSRAELLSRSRRQHIAHARQIAMYLSRELTGRATAARRGSSASFPRIGMAFGRDHSSVIHACNRIAHRQATDAELAHLLDRLALSVRGASAPQIGSATREGL